MGGVQVTNDDKRSIAALATRLARERFATRLEAWMLLIEPHDNDWCELNRMYPDNAVALDQTPTTTDKLFEAAYAHEMCRLWMEVLERRLPRYPYATCCICLAAPPCEESTGWTNRPCRACWETVLGQPGVEPGGVVFKALRGRR